MLQKRSHLVRAAIALLVVTTNFNAHGQDWRTEKKINALFSGTQLLLHGFNYEFNYIHKRVIG